MNGVLLPIGIALIFVALIVFHPRGLPRIAYCDTPDEGKLLVVFVTPRNGKLMVECGEVSGSGRRK